MASSRETEENPPLSDEEDEEDDDNTLPPGDGDEDSDETGAPPTVFSCAYCDFTTDSDKLFNSHSDFHAWEKPWECIICMKRFRLSHHLKSHMSTHSDDKPYMCDQCEYKTSRRSTLKRHIMMCHSNEKPLACSHCAYRCALPEHLRSHLRTHTGDAPFECSHCLRRFKASGSLSRHMKIHLGVKNYHCDQERCDKSFITLSSLKSHQLTHSGIKNHVCPVCNDRFSRMESLKRHLLTHSVFSEAREMTAKENKRETGEQNGGLSLGTSGKNYGNKEINEEIPGTSDRKPGNSGHNNESQGTSSLIPKEGTFKLHVGQMPTLQKIHATNAFLQGKGNNEKNDKNPGSSSSLNIGHKLGKMVNNNSVGNASLREKVVFPSDFFGVDLEKHVNFSNEKNKDIETTKASDIVTSPHFPAPGKSTTDFCPPNINHNPQVANLLAYSDLRQRYSNVVFPSPTFDENEGRFVFPQGFIQNSASKNC